MPNAILLLLFAHIQRNYIKKSHFILKLKFKPTQPFYQYNE